MTSPARWSYPARSGDGQYCCSDRVIQLLRHLGISVCDVCACLGRRRRVQRGVVVRRHVVVCPSFPEGRWTAGLSHESVELSVSMIISPTSRAFLDVEESSSWPIFGLS